ncbi:MAG TPA: tRNA lysidine(34) synthetase TilS [Flavobacteriales bacterium]|nr:tRNA lysidine(34) synthetase TilS [Flavobacteriales bacterium]
MHGAMKDVQQHVQRSLSDAGIPEPSKLIVAASGGCDSTVLLHLLLNLGHTVVVAHVDHGARGAESDGDREAVANWASQHQCKFELLELEAKKLKGLPQGFQGEARKARQTWFESLCSRHDAVAVVTGHHADDQAETYLLHAMRSADPWAVKGMALREGLYVRPMLGVRKRDLIALATSMKWRWREDSSNKSQAYLRNRIRHEVLPLMEELRPGTLEHLIDLATRATELSNLANSVLQQTRLEAESEPGLWSIEALKSQAWAREAFLRSLSKEGWSLGSARRALDLIESQVGSVVEQGIHRIVRDRNTLVVESNKTRQATHPLTLQTCEENGTKKTPFGTCQWETATCPESTNSLGLNQCWLPSAWLPVTIRSWQHGDRIQPLGMDGQTKISDVLTQAKLSPRIRPSALVLEREKDGKILWVVGHKISEHARLNPGTYQGQAGLSISFHPVP